MIRFACPGCSATFSVEDEKAGKAGKCPKCQSQFVIPSVAEAELPAATDPAPPSPFDAPQPPPLPTPPTDPNSPVEVRPCPKCQSRLSVLPADVGGKVACPNCETEFLAVRADALPPPSAGSSKSGGSLVRLGSGSEVKDDEERDRGRRSKRDDDDEDRPSRRRRSRYDDGDDDRSRRRSRRGDGYGCPSCGSTARPLHRSEISTAGWVVFAVMMAFCFPLFWIGLLIKEEFRVCADCGRRLQ